MNLLGIYHRRPYMEMRGVCDAPYIEKGAHALASADAASEGGILACAQGRMRNAAALMRELGIERDRPTAAQLTLAVYRRWGEAYFEHIEGPVTTAVIDRENDMLLVSRDRMGECPLFYAAEGGSVAFADHPDLLIESGAARPVIDADGLNELFALGPARTPGRTPYRDVHSLEPGCALIARGEALEFRPYFSLQPAEHGDGAQETVRRVREMLERAVDDIVPLKPASMLSGGIDSTALTALMRRRMQRVDSFSVDYEGNAEHFRGTSFQPERDEPYIELAVSRIGTNHLKVVLAQDELISSLEAAVDARGFPGMADVDGSLLQFARRIAPRARFIVSGECGDEVFGGYPWFRDAASLSADAFPWSGSMELRCRILKKRVRDKLRPKAYARAAVLNAIDRVEHLPREPAADKCLRTMQHMCFEFFMANLQERAASMCAYSHLGALTPFADERLVQYVYNAPWEMKFLGGREKGLLREAVKDILPEPLVYRKSSPYPRTCSPEYARMAVDLMREMLADRTNPILVFVDPDALEGAFSTDAPWFGQLMAGPQMLAYLWQVNFWMRSRRVEVSL
ncbi:MAG: asparagine synthetase B [Clostridiales bacterium]|nr:asparagine synthetase B [Clostridiales bacterium]